MFKNFMIMKNIEILQHIINGCQIEIINYKCDYVGIQYAKANGYYYIGEHLHVTYDGGFTGKSLNEFKLVLYPLSSLLKTIEVNDEKFIVAREFNYLRFDEISTFKGGCNAMDFIQVREQKILLELHFDIDGLIEKGLAIDINTIDK